MRREGFMTCPSNGAVLHSLDDQKAGMQGVQPLDWAWAAPQFSPSLAAVGSMHMKINSNAP